MAEFETRDDAYAGLLNGVMFIAVGATFPVLFIWRGATDWQSWVRGLPSMTALEAAQGGVAAFVSLWLLRLGARILWHAAAAPRRR